jgi:hypothetical protein
VKTRFIVFIFATLLPACSIIEKSSNQEIQPFSDTTAKTSISPYAPPLNCDVALIDPVEKTSELAGRCIGGWLITYQTGCIECEGVRIWFAKEGVWKPYESLNILCFYDDDLWYGQSPEKDSLTSLKLIYTQLNCDSSSKTYQPEQAQGPLKFGDTGKRVKALQAALISNGFFDEISDNVGRPDGIYGPTTVQAVMNFQYSEKITVDGVAGASTHEILKLQYS